MAATNRPKRLCVVDETGVSRTLSEGEAAFTRLGDGDETIFLGLGPNPAAALALAGGRDASYLECQDFAGALGKDWVQAIPASWRRLDPSELTPTRSARARFFLYQQNTRLFPSFWGPVWARVQLALLPRPQHAAASDTVLLLRSPAGLLEPEITRALANLGRPVKEIPAAQGLSALTAVLGREKPALAISVNAAGLDDDGLTISLLAEAGVPLAVWFVDNPFHVLGRFRGRFWQRALLCVTDDAFVAPLTALGAGRVMHLPLAASSHFFEAKPTPGLADRAVFVGSSAFAGRDQFFAGCHIPDDLAGQASEQIASGGRPDFFWWAKRLGIDRFWPGKTVRLAGCGAETTGVALRVAVLTALSRSVPLTVCGDPDWRDLLPTDVALAGPVDYVRELPGLYAGAGVSVNVTSPLLPRGLTQRHFDVWAAGGCLISDATPGLDLFPAELTGPMRFETPEAAGRLAAELLAAPGRRLDLIAAWGDHIRAAHRYEHRLESLLAGLEAR